MAQVMGKLLPNLNISIDKEADPDDMIEDGELSDEEDISEISFTNDEPAKNVDIVRRIQKLHTPKVYENKNGGFVTGLDLSSEVLMKKLEDRAERFGLEKKEEAPITQNEIDALYKSLEIDPRNLNSCELKNIRLDALHMRGVDDMSTNEIFKYFGKYGPASVEWINDCSCNVVWLDDATTARALLGKSQPLVIKKKDTNPTSQGLPDLPTTFEKKESEAIIEMSDSDEEDDDSRRIRNFKSESSMDVDASAADEKPDANVVESTSVDIPVPPGHWRVGEPHPKAKALLLRFATKDDRKIRGAEKRSHYYQKYGNPNYGGMTGLISQSRKRKMQAAKNRQAMDKFGDESSNSNEYNPGEILNRPIAKASRIKLPRMKMYADEEEKKAKGGGFRQTEFKPKPGNIHSRLGTKYTKEDLIHLGSKFSSDSEEEVEDNVEINCTVPSRFNIWTDLAKSMAKEDSAKPRTDYSSDLESDLDSYRNLRSTFQDSRSTIPDSRNVRSTFQDSRNSRSTFQDSGNFKRSREPRARDDRTLRDRLGKGDLRSTLSSHSKLSRDISPDGSRGDLRSKIRRLKREDSDTRKYRSPLLMDD